MTDLARLDNANLLLGAPPTAATIATAGTPTRVPYLELSDGERGALHDWVRLHQLEPKVVPTDATITYDATTREWVIDHGADGSPISRCHVHPAMAEALLASLPRPADPQPFGIALNLRDLLRVGRSAGSARSLRRSAAAPARSPQAERYPARVVARWRRPRPGPMRMTTPSAEELNRRYREGRARGGLWCCGTTCVEHLPGCPSRSGPVRRDEVVPARQEPAVDEIQQALDYLWGKALDVANSRDFRVPPGQRCPECGSDIGERDEAAYLAAKGHVLDHVRQRLDAAYRSGSGGAGG